MKSMRDFVELAEKRGLLHRITQEVDWDLELSHIAKLNEEKQGPALLFEKVKDYDSPVITSVCTTTQRLALIMGQPLDSTMVDLMKVWVEKNEQKIPPKWVDSGPCKENIMMGDEVDLFKFPAPKFYPRDGGRFFGTAHFVVTKDPETGWINVGTYRLQLFDENHLGTQFIKGKHADIMLKKYQAMGKPMPVAVVVGCDPLLFLMGAARVSAFESEYDLAGAIRGEPIEVVKTETNDLPVPAAAEIVVEGEVDADAFMEEGPFGEYTSYYSGVGTEPRNYIDVKCITHRDNPIFWSTTVGRAVTDTHMTMALTYGATLWQQLTAMRIPGIKAIYCPPEGAGRMLAIISVKQMYPGHADQVLTAAISTEMGAYGLKTVIVVDDDIDPWDIPRVLYALSFRFQPNRSQVIKRGRSTPLDPSVPISERGMTGRLLLDATIPYDWKEKPIPIELDPEVVKKVHSRWSELGLEQ
ncbi:MAG: phenylphosphate carboxylase subunit beta [Deltaproteobacteria bacterium]|nr:phenylphosphate carboxylase subunit beta [Deltaproteobacteria bacterium]MBW2311005.1 phenylphosphate carboxylase subunit beta [Deltaproteobacteria bacterium]RLB27969.1 MAG: phenylphosphate carboxylase subunit beta [Deltaproteobacteria bacterium]